MSLFPEYPYTYHVLRCRPVPHVPFAFAPRAPFQRPRTQEPSPARVIRKDRNQSHHALMMISLSNLKSIIPLSPAKRNPPLLPPARHPLFRRRTLTPHILHSLLIHTLTPMQKARFLDRTPALPAGNGRPRTHRARMADGSRVSVTAISIGGGDGGCEVRDVFWQRVLGADGGDAAFGGLAGFGEGVVARVEVLAFLGGGEVRLEISRVGNGRKG